MRALMTLSALALASTSCIASSWTQPSSNDVSRAAATLGLTPDSLAVVDVHGSEIPTLLNRLSENYAQYESIRAASQSLSDAILDAQAAQNTLRSSPNDTDAQLLLSQSLTAADNARASIALARDTLLNSLLTELADAALVDQVIDAEGERRKLSPAYRLAVSSQEDAKVLAWALKLQETLQGADDPQAQLPQDAGDAISSAHAQSDVQLGLARMTSYADANQAAIESWVNSN